HRPRPGRRQHRRQGLRREGSPRDALRPGGHGLPPPRHRPRNSVDRPAGPAPGNRDRGGPAHPGSAHLRDPARPGGKGWHVNTRSDPATPLRRLEDWEDFVEARYPARGEKPREDYRNYATPARDTVRDFYRLNHRHQTYDFVREKKRQ